MQSPSNKISGKRFFEIDGLKGTALFTILIYHFISYLNFPGRSITGTGLLSHTDKLISDLSYTFLFGKIYLVFSLLYGFTLFIQLGGTTGTKRYSRKENLLRLGCLFLFGIFNSIFFPGGDILVLYALMGLVTMLVSNLSNFWLMVIAAVLLAQPIQLIEIYNSARQGNLEIGAAYSDDLRNQVIATLQNGSLKDILLTNITKGPLISLVWAYESGRLTQLMGMLILGLVAGRKELFNYKRFDGHFWWMVLLVAGIVCAFIYFLKTQTLPLLNGGALALHADLAFGLWINLFFAFATVALLMLLFNSPLKKYFIPLTYMGKMSLTNYIFQSIAGAVIFLPIGFSLAAKAGATYSLLLGFAVGILMIWFSKRWLTTHRRGPLESIWNKAGLFHSPS